MDSQVQSTQRARQVPTFHRNAFLAILAMWLVLPIGLRNHLPQDAVPYVAAGRIAHTRPHEVYAARHGDLFDLKPYFRSVWCGSAPKGTDCNQFAVAFVASPTAIPLAWAIARAGAAGGTLIMRFAAALMLVGGMWLLWRRLAHRSRRAPLLLVATALLLTPMAIVPIGLGQTSPILFLSVCLGMSSRTTRRGLANTAAWVAAVTLKVFPAALVLLLAWRRRWRMLAWSAVGLAALAAASLVLVPTSTWGDFVRTTLQLSAHTSTNPYNGSLSVLVAHLWGGTVTTSTTLVARVVSLIAAAVVCWFSMRGTDDDTRWAGGYLALVLLTPLVWWHYVWVAVGALGIAVAAQKKLDDRLVAVLPATALVTVAPSIPNANGHSLPVVQALVLLAFAAAFCVLARRSRVRAVSGSGSLADGEPQVGESR